MNEIENVAEISVTYKPAISAKPIIRSALDAYRVLKEFFDENTLALQEQFVVLYMNRSNRVLGIYPLSKGGITTCVVDIRLALCVALKTASTAIMLCHNHPSGNLNPSRHDEELTAKIKEACKLVDISVFDHIIISPIDGEYFSFANEGIL